MFCCVGIAVSTESDNEGQVVTEAMRRLRVAANKRLLEPVRDLFPNSGNVPVAYVEEKKERDLRPLWHDFPHAG